MKIERQQAAFKNAEVGHNNTHMLIEFVRSNLDYDATSQNEQAIIHLCGDFIGKLMKLNFEHSSSQGTIDIMHENTEKHNHPSAPIATTTFSENILHLKYDDGGERKQEQGQEQEEKSHNKSNKKEQKEVVM